MRQPRQTSIGARRRRRLLRPEGIAIGFAVGLILTLIVGLPLYFLLDNAWALWVTSGVGLAAGGAVAALRARSPQPLNGALVGFLGYVAALVLFGGATAATGDAQPLAGVPDDDQTFFLTWPLLMVAAGMMGALLGGRARVRS